MSRWIDRYIALLKGASLWIPANKGDTLKVGTATLRYYDGEWELSQGDNDFYIDYNKFSPDQKKSPFDNKKDQTVRVTSVKKKGSGFAAEVVGIRALADR